MENKADLKLIPEWPVMNSPAGQKRLRMELEPLVRVIANGRWPGTPRRGGA